jgi:Ca2+-binding RTX toxin-like protein
MAIVNGTSGDDSGTKTLRGTNLADQILGFAGNDSLIGFDGDDLLEGGAGADQLFGSPGFDTASYRNSPTGVEVSLRDFSAEYGHAEGDQLFSIEGLRGSAFADTLQGNELRNVFHGGGGADYFLAHEGNDTLHGEGGNDVLIGHDGNDQLRGGSGNDRLEGDVGNDVLNGDAGIDTAVFRDYTLGAGSGVQVDLQRGIATGGQLGIDTLSGIENVDGTSSADLIIGNGGANILWGREGGDVLTGNGGADRFDYDSVFDSRSVAADVITDFNRAQGDKIDLSTLDANMEVSGNEAFQFIGTGPFTGAGQVRAVTSGGGTTIEIDCGDVLLGTELVIVLSSTVPMQASDFIL